MKYFLILLALIFGSVVEAQSLHKIGTDILQLGASTNSNKTFKFNIGNGSANPLLRANDSTAKLEFSHDGTTFSELGATSSTSTFVSVSSSPYTVLTSDELIAVSASGGAITLNLPTAVGVTGKRYTAIKTDSTFNAVTIDPSGAQTIGGSATTTLNTINEKLFFVSDGSNWIIFHRESYVPWTSYTPTFTNYGVVLTQEFWWSRAGDSILIKGKFTSAASTASEGRISLPSGLTTSSTKIVSTTVETRGEYGRAETAVTSHGGFITVARGLIYFTLSNFDTFGSASVVPIGSANGADTCPNANICSIDSDPIPISGWN